MLVGDADRAPDHHVALEVHITLDSAAQAATAATPPAGTPITLDTHTSHMNNVSVVGTNYYCGDCHATTVTSPQDGVITGSGTHATGTKDVSMPLGGVWNTGAKTCTTTYCHSSGKGAYQSPAAWNVGTAMGCNGCHGTTNAIGAPDYANAGTNVLNSNSHSNHASAATDCDACHTGTVNTAGTAIKAGSTLHTNNAMDVTFNAAKAGSATWTTATKTCSNISCHSGGSAQWGGSLSCTGCHGGNAGSGTPITIVTHTPG